MANYQEARFKLTNPQLNNLKSAEKKKKEKRKKRQEQY